MCRPNVGSDGIDPEAEEAIRRYEPLGKSDVGMSLSSASMLEHLYADHDGMLLF